MGGLALNWRCSLASAVPENLMHSLAKWGALFRLMDLSTSSTVVLIGALPAKPSARFYLRMKGG